MRLSIFIITTLLTWTLSACDVELNSPLKEDNHQTYTIKKGEHSSNAIPKAFKATSLTFQAKFDSTAIYRTQLEENQVDINKLMGFSDCSSHHHENSARFGWRWYNSQLEIHAYCYVKGTRISEFVTAVSLNTMNEYKIELTNDMYIFTVNNSVKVEMEKDTNCSGSTNYMLFPYFGGDEPAPHDIKVTVAAD